MPVDVLLVPAKRTVYTANVYVSTDSGPGGKLGFERRWLNKRGHKLSSRLQYSTRLQDISTKYRIPKPGPRNRTLTFGVGYRDEETDTQHLAHGARGGDGSDRPLEGLHAHARPAVSERRLRNRRASSTRRACSTPKGC